MTKDFILGSMGFPGMVVNQSGPDNIQVNLFPGASWAGRQENGSGLGDWRRPCTDSSGPMGQAYTCSKIAGCWQDAVDQLFAP